MPRCLSASALILTLLALGPASGSGDRLAAQGAAGLTDAALEGLTLRSLGPSITTGRISDVAVDPRDPSVWYVAASSGGLWKTINRGNTWTPIFDDYGSYSLGCVTIDPHDSNVIWLGTGENQSQRSVGYGDGVYRSDDAGRTWRRMGLEASEHIAKIVVDPRDPNVVWVASQGPLWAPGGDRGLYKTTDRGRTWNAVLEVSENTGITDVVLDPRNPDVVYAASYQRRRHEGLLIAGGPESAIYKSPDGGKRWMKLATGLPLVDTGRIALAVSPQLPDVVYALIAAAGKESGFFRSANAGESWTRQSDYIVVDPQYYGEIYADPHRAERVYAVDVRINVTDDGGRTFTPVDWAIHSDNHAITFDPADPEHLLVGNDGGLYETWDGGATWRHFTNLPLSQFYRLALDDREPFYHAYGGMQDNGTIGGPIRTFARVGIRTSDWYSVGGGDGMQARVEPGNPSIVYSMSQYGAIQRLNLETGEQKGIRPQVGDNDPPVRWNWETPFLLSPHAPTRLYLAGSRVFRSDDRGESWRAISPDLTRQIDRDTLPVMGKVWGPDAVWKNVFTTDLGVGTAFDESPLQEGLLYYGTDEGLVQVSEDGGKRWRKIEQFPGVPDQTYVSDLVASRHDANVVYAAFNHHKRGDFAPYILRSADRGRTWTSMAGNLPARHVVWTVLEDTEDPNLLFTGTEFGLFFTIDGGRQWTRLRGGMPTIAVRDLAIDPSGTDLVVATFGRGFYVLDDMTALRHLTPAAVAADAALFPPRAAVLYPEWGYIRAAWGNETNDNPPYGAILTYRVGAGASGTLAIRVADSAGNVVRTIEVDGATGFHRASWDLRGEPPSPPPGQARRGRPQGELVSPGRFTATLGRLAGESFTPIGQPVTVEVIKP